MRQEIFNPILQGEKFDKQGLYVKNGYPNLREFQVNLFINHGKWKQRFKKL